MHDIFQIRFIQESYESVVIQVVKESGTEKTTEDLEKILLNEFSGEFGDGVTISFEWLDIIPPESNGKIRIMISKVK